MTRREALEGLLGRVQKNAALPRAVALAPRALAEAAPESSGFAELDHPDIDHSSPDSDGSLGLSPPSVQPLANAMDASSPIELDAPGLDQAMSLDQVGDAPEVMDLDGLEEVDLVEEFAGEDLELDPPDGEEAPPESHSGPARSAPNLARAIAEQEMADAGHREPPLTPPPESGEEPATPVSIPQQRVPTMEQLGETVALEEGPARDFDLDEPTISSPDEMAAKDELGGGAPVSERRSSTSPVRLEAELPSGSGVYSDDLALPSEARAELERVRLGERSDVRAEVISRPVISTNVVDFVHADRAFHPTTFGELLDATLGL